MQLSFEEIAIVGSGKYPDFVQFDRTEGELFFLDSGLMYGTPTEKLHGKFEDPTWLNTYDITPEGDTSLSNLEIKSLNGFGAVGSYRTINKQVMIIYEYQYDMSKYLSAGRINFSIDSPISSFSLTLRNPIDEETGIEGNIIMNEVETLLKPGSKVVFKFSIGSSYDEYDIGTFYVDRAKYDLLSDKADVDGRNLIGKALKDQTINENNNIGYDIITNILSSLLEQSNLGIDQFEVEYNTTQRRFKFNPNKTFYGAIEEILKTMVDWKMEETHEGEILIGSPEYGLFPKTSMYTFKRNEDIFSRSISMDDDGSYRIVCVYDQNWNIEVYKEIKTYTGWNLQSKKTLFVEVAEGTSLSNATEIAENLAERLESVGKIETFNGPFRPHLLVGDGATIVDERGNTDLGIITEIQHQFGESGFYTSFTVDSGGRLGKGRLSDFIKKIENKQEAGSVWYEDIEN